MKQESLDQSRGLSPSAQSGFTIIELVLVVVIIGIVAAFSLPKIDYTKYRVNSSMRGLGTTLLGAQRRAVSRQHDVIVSFIQAQNAIRIHEDENNNGEVDGSERTRRLPLGEHVVFGRGSTPAYTGFAGGPIILTRTVGGLPALTFHRSGSASEMGGIYLTSYRGLLGDARLITIERSTGRVSWLSYSSSRWEQGF